MLSHPTWVRGLKLIKLSLSIHRLTSHPTWVRGLKLRDTATALNIGESHPTWVRGLKQEMRLTCLIVICVAPYVGAWIETSWVVGYNSDYLSRTLRGCVD